MEKFPITLQKCVNTVLKEYDWSTKEKARYECRHAAELVCICIEMIRCTHTPKPKVGGSYYHCWAKMGPWNIDLTARQFNPSEDYPKIWHDYEPSKAPYHAPDGTYKTEEEYLKAVEEYNYRMS